MLIISVIRVLRRRKGLQLQVAFFVFDQQLDFLFHFVELLVAILDQAHAFLESFEGLFER